MATDIDDWVADYDRASREAPALRLVQEPQWIHTTPPAEDLKPQSFQVRGQEPTGVWTYHAADGAPLGYVCRYESSDGKKTVLTWSYGRLEGEKADRWALKHFSKPRPLYNLHLALEHPERQLVFVEGEKCAHVAQALMPQQVVMTWPGGAQAARFADLAPLQARTRKAAFLWPDADDPGRKAMSTIAEALFLIGYDVMVLQIEGQPDGWDCVDAMAEGIKLPQFIRDHAKPYLTPKMDQVLPETPPPLPTVTHNEAPPAPSDQWRIDDWIYHRLVLNANKPVANLSNISLVLDAIKQGEIWYDEFLDKVLTYTSDRKATREWTDGDDTMLTIEIQRRCGLAAARITDVRTAVQAHARKDCRNEVTQYLNQLSWDRVPRLDSFFEDICSTPRSPYYAAAGRNFFIGMVARAYRPGCKLDTMIVLEGKQGILKSTLLSIIGGRWYAIMRDAPETKDFGITLQGKWLIEIAEMDAFSRADVKAVKRTLSTADDRYRKPFGVHAEDHPRRSVFAGSTNRDDWLNDETGARRSWPIACQYINVQAAKDMRDQLFAEACHEFHNGATWWEMPEEETKSEQAKRYEEDPWQPHIEEALLGRTSISMSAIMEKLGIEAQHQDKKCQMRVGAVMRLLGYQRATVWDAEAGKPRRLWKLK